MDTTLWKRNYILMHRFPELVKTVKRLQKELAELRKSLLGTVVCTMSCGKWVAKTARRSLIETEPAAEFRNGQHDSTPGPDFFNRLK